MGNKNRTLTFSYSFCILPNVFLVLKESSNRWQNFEKRYYYCFLQELKILNNFSVNFVKHVFFLKIGGKRCHCSQIKYNNSIKRQNQFEDFLRFVIGNWFFQFAVPQDAGRFLFGIFYGFSFQTAHK